MNKILFWGFLVVVVVLLIVQIINVIRIMLVVLNETGTMVLGIVVILENTNTN